MQFQGHEEAGRRLAAMLRERIGSDDAAVFAVPRGGVVLGAAVASRLGVRLEAVVVRAIGHPYNPAYTIGAVTEKGEPFINRLEAARLQLDWLSRRVSAARREARLMRELYTRGRTPLGAAGYTAVLVDEGVITGCTLEAAMRELREQGARRLIVAVPQLPVEIAMRLRSEAIDLVALEEVASRRLSEGWRRHFAPATDQDVMRALGVAPSAPPPAPA